MALVMGGAWVTRLLDQRYVDVAWITFYCSAVSGLHTSGAISPYGSVGSGEGLEQSLNFANERKSMVRRYLTLTVGNIPPILLN